MPTSSLFLEGYFWDNGLQICHIWQLQEAKNKLSQLVKAADKGVPQYITVHGKSTAVILSTEEYEKLKRPKTKLSSRLLMPILDDAGECVLAELIT